MLIRDTARRHPNTLGAIALCVLLALFLCICAVPARGSDTAAGQFVVTKVPLKDGARILADLPASQHKRNVGGSDGAGLCVYTSTWHLCLWQSVSDLYEFRKYMEARPGGSYPDKFEQTLASYCKSKGIACPGYVQHTGGDEEFLELALRTGRMIGVTYCGVDGPGRYGNEVIGHMVNLVHLDQSTAAILDNNFPGTWLWMSRGDFLARWRGIQPSGKPWLGRDERGRLFPIGGGWAIVLLGPPPAPYPVAPTARIDAVTPAPCVCGDACTCAAGECPSKCPVGSCHFERVAVPFFPEFGWRVFCREGTEPIQFRSQPQPSCPNGKCPNQAPQGFAPLFTFPAPAVVPEQMPTRYAVKDLPAATSFPREPAPRAGFHWKNVPGRGDCWIEDTGAPFDWGMHNGKWGWVPREKVAPIEAPAAPARPEQKAEAPAGAEEPTVPAQADYPTGGVDSQRLTTEKRWHVNGERVTKAEAHAALSLTDDSDRWHLAAVGEPTFLRKVRDDVAALPAATRAKLHVQTYSPADWPVAQFKLGAGVTLRQPAHARIGADVATCPVNEYTAAKLVELLAAPTGPTPAPTPVPAPKPKEPEPAPAPAPAPAPNVRPAPAPADPAAPSGPGFPLVLAIGGALLLWWILR